MKGGEVTALVQGPAFPSFQCKRKNGSFKAGDGGYRESVLKAEAGELEVSLLLTVQSMLGCWFIT